MNIDRIALTLIEDGDRRWLCLPSGALIEITAADVHKNGWGGQFQRDVSYTQAALKAMDGDDSWMERGEICTDLIRQWERRFTVFANRASEAASPGAAKRDDPWERRFDGVTKSCYLLVKRGSIHARVKRERMLFGTWRRFLKHVRQGCKHLDSGWGGGGEWDKYTNGLASNLRKRFRDKTS